MAGKSVRIGSAARREIAHDAPTSSGLSVIILSCANFRSHGWLETNYDSSHERKGLNAVCFDGSGRWIMASSVTWDSYCTGSPYSPEGIPQALVNDVQAGRGTHFQLWAKRHARLGGE